VCLKRAAPPLHRPGAQPWRPPSATFLAPSAPSLSLNRALIPPILLAKAESRGIVLEKDGKPMGIQPEGVPIRNADEISTQPG
jgi:hypothetical protein